jgi:hypothetical protein
MKQWLLCVALACAPLCAAPSAAQRLPDEPGVARTERSRPASTPARYADALATWKAPEDIAAFLDATFVYDRPRALALAESPGASARPSIHSPEQLFAEPTGVCVDLARFGVESLNRIDARFRARYLMIEFEPVTVAGRTLRRHWVALFERDGATYAFADSYRPGHVAGPFRSVDDYVADYAGVRARPIVRFEERASFERRTRATRSVRS